MRRWTRALNPTIVRTDGARADILATRSAGVRRALLIVLLLNALSAALKIGVGARTGALTVLGAALESVLDMLSNVVAIFAVSVAAREPDDDHPYGHEKFETLGTLGIVGFLSISCFELLRREHRRAHREPRAACGVRRRCAAARHVARGERVRRACTSGGAAARSAARC